VKHYIHYGLSGKMSTLLGQKKQVTKSLGKNMHSPDLAPMDFAVFPYIKSFLWGMRFDNLSELRQAVMNV
jgi:hypothetical protein